MSTCQNPYLYLGLIMIAHDSSSTVDLASTLRNVNIGTTNAQTSSNGNDDPTTVVRAGVSEETLTLLGVSATDKKRKRDESEDPRAGYPKESKAIYLILKSLYKKKLNLANILVKAERSTQLKRQVPQCVLRCPVPPRLMGITKYKDDWLVITQQARELCTELYIKAIREMFNATNTDIAQHIETLARLCSVDQLAEMKTTLKEGYIKAAKNLTTSEQPELRQNRNKGVPVQGQRKFMNPMKRFKKK